MRVRGAGWGFVGGKEGNGMEVRMYVQGFWKERKERGGERGWEIDCLFHNAFPKGNLVDLIIFPLPR